MSLVRAHVLWFDFDGSVGAGLYGTPHPPGHQGHYQVTTQALTTTALSEAKSPKTKGKEGEKETVPSPPFLSVRW